VTSRLEVDQHGSPVSLYRTGLLDLSPESVIVYDAGGTVRYWNTASRDLYGWAETVTLGHNLDPLSSSGWLPWPVMLGIDRWEGLVKRRTVYGSDVQVRVVAHVRRGQHEQIIEIVEFGRLESDRLPDLARVEARRETGSLPERRFEQLLDHMPIALWEIDARAAGQNFERLRQQGITSLESFLQENPAVVDFTCDTVLISRVNLAAIRLFGASCADDLLGPIRYLYSETLATANRIMCAHWNGQRHHLEQMKVRTCDGRVLEVLFLATFLQLAEEVATTFLMLVDITDQVRSESELAALRADFAHAVRISTLGQLVSSIGHELRQPLASAATHGRAVLDALDRGREPSEHKVLIEAVMSEAMKANATISRVRSMAVRETARSEPICLSAIARSAVEIVRQSCRDKSIAITEDLDAGLPPVLGDPVQLQQVVVNLLMNAIQSFDLSPASGSRIDISTHSLGDTAALEVRDNGRGIPKLELDRIFDSFISSRGGSLGLGLSICRSVVEAHRGYIRGASIDEGGSIFEFQLPIHVPPPSGSGTALVTHHAN
jgi:signal transduction histidine kinase